MHTLTLDTSNSARPNTYHVSGVWGGLVEVVAYVAPTDVTVPRVVRLTIQIDGPPRRRDRDGVHALLATRIEGTTYSVESAVVHPELARDSYVLLGLEVP
jgi:hypothetical protein